jgi:hypothetical protein
MGQNNPQSASVEASVQDMVKHRLVAIKVNEPAIPSVLALKVVKLLFNGDFANAKA